VHHDVEIGAGSGDAASGAAGWLAFAAAPTFAVMAVWTGAFGGQPDVLCTAVRDGAPLNGMALMYALMTAFHAPPWLKLVSRRWRGTSSSRAWPSLTWPSLTWGHRTHRRAIGADAIRITDC